MTFFYQHLTFFLCDFFSEKLLYTQRNKDIFYVQKDGWKRNVCRRGLLLFTQVHRMFYAIIVSLYV